MRSCALSVLHIHSFEELADQRRHLRGLVGSVLPSLGTSLHSIVHLEPILEQRRIELLSVIVPTLPPVGVPASANLV